MKNIAVIGYGGQGAWHCSQILASDVCTLTGTYDIRQVRNDAAKANGIFVYDSNEAIFADTTVDIVVIAVPNDSHEYLVINALQAGKHVICEKPVEMSVASVDRMIAASKKAGQFLAVLWSVRATISRPLTLAIPATLAGVDSLSPQGDKAECMCKS